MKKKVCQFTIAHLTEDERIFHKECKSLLEDFDVTLVATSGKDEVKDGINIIGLGMPKGAWQRLKRIFSIVPVLVKQNADIYHFHDPELVITGYILKKFYGKRVAYDVHEHYTNKMKSKSFGKLKLFKPIIVGIWSRMERWMAKSFDLIVSADSVTAQQFPPDRTITIGNFPTLEFIKDAAPRSVPEKEEDFRVVYLGTIHEQRGLRKCVEAIEKVKYPGIKLHIIGNSNFPELTELFQKSSRVVYHGRIPWEKLSAELNKCSVGLILLQPVSAFMYYPGENIVKLFEYGGMGIPYIMSDFPGLKKFNEKNGGGITVDPTDTDLIARTIEKLYEDKELFHKLSKEGIEMVRKEYNWDMQAQKLTDAYNRILNG